MRLQLSEKAAMQMGKIKSEEEPKGISEEKQAEIEAREAKRQAKAELKQLKVAARETARQADVDLQAKLDAYRDIEANIAAADTRVVKDNEEHEKRCAKSQAHLQKLQRQLERIHAEVGEARTELEAVQADVPKSVAGVQERQERLQTQCKILGECYQGNEAAWKAEHLTGSAKRKRNVSLRRVVKHIVS